MKKFVLKDIRGWVVANVYARNVEEIVSYLNSLDPSVQIAWRRDDQKIPYPFAAKNFALKETISCTIFDKSGDDYGKRNEIRTKLAQVLEGYGETTTGAYGMVQRMEDNAIFDRLWRGVGSLNAFTIWEVKASTGIFQALEDCKQYITINKILHR